MKRRSCKLQPSSRASTLAIAWAVPLLGSCSASDPPAGLIVARCVVTVRGKTKHCCIVRGLDGYNLDFLLALGKWRYEPARLRGEPVTVAH